MAKNTFAKRIASKWMMASMYGPEYDRLQHILKLNPRDREALARLHLLEKRLRISPGYHVSILKEFVSESFRETGHRDIRPEWLEEGEDHDTLEELIDYSLGGNLKNSWEEMSKTHDGISIRSQREEDYTSDVDVYYTAFIKRKDRKPFSSKEIQYLKSELRVR